ncbi:hypothetical protein SAMN05660742_12144 [Propionispira arboris]|uniref:Methyltransferase domain-containing protein n=2 Tax=Propionispira arboris TaxID=84035 RepID=A0A1H7CGY1_9FIRM|nr:hypothetical protein SAMN05660742_12144 [Propionispira arboris]
MYLIARRMGIKLKDDIILKEMLAGHVDSKDFFRRLRFSVVHIMDISDYEDADIIYDLNVEKISSKLEAAFDYIIDGGTLEHVFNIANALKNIFYMLNENGGNIYHYLPVSGYINHGFYSILPCLLNEFYSSNGGSIENCNIVLWNDEYEANMRQNILPTFLEDFLLTGIDYRILDLRDTSFDILHGYKGILRCVARQLNKEFNGKQQQNYWHDNHIKQDALISGLSLLKYGVGQIGIYGMGDTTKQFMRVIEKCEMFSKDSIRGFLQVDLKKKANF